MPSNLPTAPLQPNYDAVYADEDEISFIEFQKNVTLEQIENVAKKHSICSLSRVSRWLLYLFQNNFKQTTSNFSRNDILIKSTEKFILTFMENITFFYTALKANKESQGIKHLQIEYSAYTHQKNKFIESMSDNLKSIKALNQFYQYSTALTIIEFIKSEFNDFPEDFFRPVLADASTSFNNLVSEINQLSFEPSSHLLRLNPELVDINASAKNSQNIKFGFTRKGRKASNHFTFYERALTAKNQKEPSFKDIWTNSPNKLICHTTSKIREILEKNKRDLKHGHLQSAFQRNAMVAQFSPYVVADAISRLVNDGHIHTVNSIFDPIGGWGDRLVGALAYFVSQYKKIKNPMIISNDANPELVLKYKALFQHFKDLYPEIMNNLNFQTFNCAIENFPLDKFFQVTEGSRLDMAITSPPYFDIKANTVVEQYPLHNDDNETKQSSRYKNQLEWTQGFYHPFICKVLSSSWIFFLNVPFDAEITDLVPHLNAKKKSDFPYFHETKNAISRYEKESGYFIRFIYIGTYQLSGTTSEAVYIMKHVEPSILYKPLSTLNPMEKGTKKDDDDSKNIKISHTSLSIFNQPIQNQIRAYDGNQKHNIINNSNF